MAAYSTRPISLLALACAAGALAAAGPGRAGADAPPAAVQALFDLDARTRCPFPSNRFTVADPGQNTGLRVALAKPDCAARPSDCADLDAINALDGFSITPRMSIPLDGDIDLATVTGETVFLLRLGSTLPHARPGSARVGINQIVWDVATRTLHVEPEEQLDQATRYALFVTSGVRDLHGRAIGSDAFARFRRELNLGQTGAADLKGYRKELLEALAALERAGSSKQDVVVASVFTTRSITTELEKIRDQLDAATPAPATFDLGGRTVFELAAIGDVAFRTQTTTAPGFAAPVSFAGLLRYRPGAIGTIAFGRYRSPDYRAADRVFPPTRTRVEAPQPLGSNEIVFDLYLPSGARPAAGWPVAIVGHGATLHKNNGPPVALAATLASRGIATIAINGPGNGGGPLSAFIVTLPGGAQVTFPSGGRQRDVNGDGVFSFFEGGDAAFFPYRGRDRIRQTVVDLMQLVRVIEVGIDVDQDGAPDLDASRITFAGQSFGGLYGLVFLALEPGVGAGALNNTFPYLNTVLSPVLGRPNFGAALAARVPSMINPPGIAQIGGVAVIGSPAFRFTDNTPLRNQPPVINTTAGAMEIQELVETCEWVQQSASGSAYAVHLRERPLDGVPAKAVLVQLAKGDQSAPNPLSVDVIRAGGLAGATTLYRHDLAFARNPALPRNPHDFFATTLGSTAGGLAAAAAGSIARAAQEQIADFLASDGATIVDPDGADVLFETPIAPPLPESDLSFIP